MTAIKRRLNLAYINVTLARYRCWRLAGCVAFFYIVAFS